WRRIGRYGITAICAIVICLMTRIFSTTGLLTLLLGVLQTVLLLISLIQIARMIIHYRQSERELENARVLMYPGRLNKVIWYRIRILFCERGTFYNLSNREWDAFDHY